jgi:DNA-binding transcriptional LysR family regulator
MVGLLAPDSGKITPLDFNVGGKALQMTLPAKITVPGAETNVASACLGLGIVQVPRYRVAEEVRAGALVEILAAFPPSALPVHALYSHTRQLSPRLRVFLDWVAERYRMQPKSANETEI